jgi:hypothetical protein
MRKGSIKLLLLHALVAIVAIISPFVSFAQALINNGANIVASGDVTLYVKDASWDVYK